MIRIEIEGPSEVVLAEMQALLNGIRQSTEAATGVAAVVEETKPTPKPRASKKSDAAPAAETGSDKTSDAKSADDSAEEGASKSEAQSSVGVEGVDPSNKDSVRAYLSQSIDVLTGAVVTQVFSEFGASKFGEVNPEQYGAMIVRLDELRKAKEAEEA